MKVISSVIATHFYKAEALGEHIAKYIIFETFFMLTSFTFLSFIWALATPTWIETLLQKSFKKLITIITLIAVGTVVYIVIGIR